MISRRILTHVIIRYQYQRSKKWNKRVWWYANRKKTTHLKCPYHVLDFEQRNSSHIWSSALSYVDIRWKRTLGMIISFRTGHLLSSFLTWNLYRYERVHFTYWFLLWYPLWYLMKHSMKICNSFVISSLQSRRYMYLCVCASTWLSDRARLFVCTRILILSIFVGNKWNWLKFISSCSVPKSNEWHEMKSSYDRYLSLWTYFARKYWKSIYNNDLINLLISSTVDPISSVIKNTKIRIHMTQSVYVSRSKSNWRIFFVLSQNLAQKFIIHHRYIYMDTFLQLISIVFVFFFRSVSLQ